MQQHCDNIKHIVVIIVKEDNFIRGKELRAEPYQLLCFDLDARSYREIVGHDKLSPIIMLIDDEINPLSLLLSILYLKCGQKSSV